MRLSRYSILVLYERFSVLIAPAALALDPNAEGPACPFLGDHGVVFSHGLHCR